MGYKRKASASGNPLCSRCGIAVGIYKGEPHIETELYDDMCGMCKFGSSYELSLDGLIEGWGKLALAVIELTLKDYVTFYDCHKPEIARKHKAYQYLISREGPEDRDRWLVLRGTITQWLNSWGAYPYFPPTSSLSSDDIIDKVFKETLEKHRKEVTRHRQVY